MFKSVLYPLFSLNSIKVSLHLYLRVWKLNSYYTQVYIPWTIYILIEFVLTLYSLSIISFTSWSHFRCISHSFTHLPLSRNMTHFFLLKTVLVLLGSEKKKIYTSWFLHRLRDEGVLHILPLLPPHYDDTLHKVTHIR